MNTSRTPRTSDERTDELLRRDARHELEDGSGRLRPRVEARIAASTRTEPTRGTLPNRLIATVAVAMIAVAIGWIIINSRPGAAPDPMIHPPLRLGVVIERRADALMNARPEQPILTEARRLRTDVERGISFVRSVLPRLRTNG